MLVLEVHGPCPCPLRLGRIGQGPLRHCHDNVRSGGDDRDVRDDGGVGEKGVEKTVICSGADMRNRE